MTYNRRRQMQTNPPEKEYKHGRPFRGLDDGPEEYLLSETVTKHGECKGREHVEDDGHADEDLPGCEVELVDVVIEPTYYEVVG